MGSNSLKMTNYNINSDGIYKPYHHESARIRLGGWFDDDIIKTKQIDKTVDMLKLFKNIVDFENMDYVIPIATSAVRDAANKAEMIERISEDVGFSFSVLSEQREAVYSYVGAVRALQIPTCIFFDLGGGSIEIVYAKEYRIRRIVSLPLGALRLTQKFCKDSSKGRRYERTRRHISKLLPSRDELGADSATPIIGVGGTIRAMAKYEQERMGYPLNKVHNYAITAESIRDITDELCKSMPEKIAKIDAIGSGRADIIQAGACVVTEFVCKIKASQITASAHGLREGTLAVHLNCNTVQDCQKSDVEVIQNAVRVRATRVPEYAKNITGLMSSVNLISAREQQLLAHAASHMDKLSSFRDVDNVLHLVLDDDSMLSHRDQIIVALSLIHAKKKKSVRISKYRQILDLNDMHVIKKISGIVSMCDMFHRTGAVVMPSFRDKTLYLNIHASKNPFPKFLLGRTCEKLEEVLDISIDVSISHDDAGMS